MGSVVKEFKSVNAIANCIEVAAAEVTAPSTDLRRRDGSLRVQDDPEVKGQRSRSSRVTNSLAHATANPAIGKKKAESKFEVEWKAFYIVVNRGSRYESRTLDIVTSIKRIAEEESGYAVKSVPIEADPRKPYAQGVRRSSSPSPGTLSVRVQLNCS